MRGQGPTGQPGLEALPFLGGRHKVERLRLASTTPHFLKTDIDRDTHTYLGITPQCGLTVLNKWELHEKYIQALNN